MPKNRTMIAGALAAGLASGAAAEVTLINVFEVPEGQTDATIQSWESARDFLKSEPGYISTQLHGALLPDAKYQLINVAKWESAEAFMAATTRMRNAGVFRPVAGVTVSPALYSVIRED